ncbi:MAG: hypothetical protein PHP00_09015 [Thiotrichaceae bacterium]|nr:hypothetical protein [Thiotrichaceae bacterium]
MMNESIKSLHDQKVESLANELLQKGYKVTVEPLVTDLPFKLGNYRPDLIASKDKGGIILEVKTNQRFSVDRFQELAQKIAEHEHWRFLLVTLDDVTKNLLPESDDDLPSWNELSAKTESISALIQQRMLEPAVLYLWGTIEAMLRKRAIVQKLPIERLHVVTLLDHMYSSGEVSMSEFDSFKSILDKRNRVAHGLVTSLKATELEDCLSMTCSLIEQWKECN